MWTVNCDFIFLYFCNIPTSKNKVNCRLLLCLVVITKNILSQYLAQISAAQLLAHSDAYKVLCGCTVSLLAQIVFMDLNFNKIRDFALFLSF